MKFHLDECVHPAISDALQRRGIDTTAARDVQLVGVGDEDQLRFAVDNGRVLVTHDEDFLRMDAMGVSHLGIVYCHTERHSVGELIRLLVLVHGCLTDEEMLGHVEFV